jgi:hypothetical protein
MTNDIRPAAGRLLESPGFTLVAILTVALGIAAAAPQVRLRDSEGFGLR